MAGLPNPQAVWIDGPVDAAPITSVWRDVASGAAAAVSPAFLIDDGSGDLVFSSVGPADAEAIDHTGTGVYDVTLLPTGLTGPRLTALDMGGGDIVVF